ncbi:MAG: GH3 auxin-responsive promoter family protein [Phycisphaerales bacterium]|nr:GH3 auxin-responsive promoter family protein [Phycisphaerales bacterium]
MSLRWTSLIGTALHASTARRRRLLADRDWWTRNTAHVQLEQLSYLLRHARTTRFGIEHGFGAIARHSGSALLRAFRERVPISDFSAFRSAITEMRQHGARDVLWPGLIKHYAQTSGTTAGDKFIPVSQEMMRSNFRSAMDIFALSPSFGVSLPDLTRGRSLFLGGSTDLSINQHGIATGDLSGLVTPLIRWPLSEIYSPGPTVALMSDWTKKIEAMAQQCVTQDIRMVSGMSSWQLVLFSRVIELARTRNASVRTLRDVWPNLRLLVHGGVRYAPFDPRMREAWSGDTAGEFSPARLELYPASEAFVAMQDTPGDPSLRLMSDVGNFFEFVPVEEISNASPTAHAAHEVEPGQRYVVVLSTCAGLWRCILGDVVVFDTVPDDPFAHRVGNGPARLRIVGRHKHFINAFGENLIVENIETAVAHAAGESGLVVGEFTAAPVYPGVGTRAGLELVVELSNPAPAALARFASAFDESLKSQCVDYSVKRSGDLGMTPPRVTPVGMGTVHRWMASRGKLGGQHKCPRCANSREYVDGVRKAGGGVDVLNSKGSTANASESITVELKPEAMPS